MKCRICGEPVYESPEESVVGNRVDRMSYLFHLHEQHRRTWGMFITTSANLGTPSLGVSEWLDNMPDELLTLLELSE